MNLELKLKRISIRARVAYSILCLERAVFAMGKKKSDWNVLLNRLWSYTDLEYLDEWHECVAELIPSTIIQCKTYNECIGSDDVVCLDLVIFVNLKRIYSEADDFVLEIV